MRNNIKKIREKKGLNQKQLAEMIDTYPQQMSRLEIKNDIPEWKWLDLIAKALNVNVLELIFDEEDWKKMDFTNINHSIVSQGGSHSNNIETLSELENEMLEIFRKLSIKEKAKALIDLYALLEKAE